MAKKHSNSVPVEGDIPVTIEMVHEAFQVIVDYLDDGDLDPVVKGHLFKRYSEARDIVLSEIKECSHA